MEYFYYAQLNENNICVGVSMLSGVINEPDCVEIDGDNYDDYVGRKYENGTWSAEKFLPPTPVLQETLEQKIDRLELQRQSDNLTQFDVLATIYEELLISKGSV
jgi:hypothetical protein